MEKTNVLNWVYKGPRIYPIFYVKGGVAWRLTMKQKEYVFHTHRDFRARWKYFQHPKQQHTLNLYQKFAPYRLVKEFKIW